MGWISLGGAVTKRYIKCGAEGRQVLVILEWLGGRGVEGNNGIRGCASQVVGEMS